MSDSRQFVCRFHRQVFASTGDHQREDREETERDTGSKSIGPRTCARRALPVMNHRKPTRAPEHGREFALLGRDSRAHAVFRTRPPIGCDRLESVKNITPRATIVAESSMGSVRNPSAMTGESGSRNCSVV